jgi:hypothetical protein
MFDRSGKPDTDIAAEVRRAQPAGFRDAEYIVLGKILDSTIFNRIGRERGSYGVVLPFDEGGCGSRQYLYARQPKRRYKGGNSRPLATLRSYIFL